MNLGIAGKKALIFGGSRGLGLAVAKALAAEGVDVAIVARDKQHIEQVVADLNQSGAGNAVGFAADLSDINSVMNAIDGAEKALGQIDILLNNSGGPAPSGVIGVSGTIWQQFFQSMILSIFQITDRVLVGMRARGWGRILTVASSTIIEPNVNLGISNTLRSALSGWSKTLATEVAVDGITVNLLLPGPFSSDRTLFLDKKAAERRGCSPEQVHQERIKQIPVGRYGDVDEFGAVAAFMASKQAAYITGSMIRIDGGMLRSV